MTLKTLTDTLDLDGRVVFLRVDANVPLDDGVITDDGRIRAFLPTLLWLSQRGARVVLASHLGRPEGVPVSHLSMAPVAARTAELLGSPVPLVPGVSGESVWSALEALAPGDVCFLENLRFDPRETSKAASARLELAMEWASHVDATVVDGFGVVHRKQASVYELPHVTDAFAGFLVEKEVEVLERLTARPDRPYTVVLGGSKVSDKLGVIEALLPTVDQLVIGGGMVFTVLAAQGHAVGKSLLESDQIVVVKGFLALAGNLGVDIVLPTDIVMAESFSPEARHVTLPADQLESGPAGSEALGLDIGPESAALFHNAISQSHTVFWNGPMGVFEFDAFSHGTKAVAQALTEVSGLSVVGGGDSAAAVRSLGFADEQFGHISTGGGASLEFLEGKHLPGLEILGWQPPVAPS
ncbi:MAG: phosphoglycerate kinase [Pontimonas sp.]|nr:phosphoglycerate kinase [Pontimonas sp.]